MFRWDGRSIGLYDGSKDVSGHFEEHCGLAFSSDSPTWRGVSADGPAVGSNGGPGSVRLAGAGQEARARPFSIPFAFIRVQDDGVGCTSG